MPDLEDDNPWNATPSSSKPRELSSLRNSYAEPDVINRNSPLAAEPNDPFKSAYNSSYPPPSANPFNVSRTSALRSADSPHKGSSVRLQTPTSTVDSAATPLSSPGTDGPLTYSWEPKTDRVILGVAVVDFNHLVGPIVEWSYPEDLTTALSRDEDLTRLLPFLALPDGAHLSEEDYSYFHCVYSPKPPPEGSDPPSEIDFPEHQTIFGISCNRQIPAVDLLYKPDDVTRSTVQKAVVVLASRPVFGPIRDKLGVVTRAFFAQRDFSQTDLLPQFYNSLEAGLIGKESEAGMYIGTSLRELLHKFRHKTLNIVKLLMLQKRIMLYGYPVERLCTYQYSLISLMPGLLFNLADAGEPSLDFRTRKAKRPTSLRTSDRNSLLRYMGLPLHTFGADAFFQPYLPLQQIDKLVAKSWLIGTTNSIVTQQRDAAWDLLINIDTNTFQFRDKEVEKLVTLTASDRVWMDEVVRSVEETWNPSDPTRPVGMSFRGSDDDLRSKFEEYICSALATVKYADFVASGQTSTPAIGETPVNISAPFSEKWLEALRQTEACKTWYKSTDELLFDICEPRHPCEGKANAISDIGIRLTEGLHDLHLQDQLAPTREAINSALLAGSSSLFKAFDGVRSEVASRLREREGQSPLSPTKGTSTLPTNQTTSPPAATTTPTASTSLSDVRSTISGFGSFFGSKIAAFQSSVSQPAAAPSSQAQQKSGGLRPLNLSASAAPAPASPAKSGLRVGGGGRDSVGTLGSGSGGTGTGTGTSGRWSNQSAGR